MSAFIVQPHTIDKAVSLIWHARGTTPLMFGSVLLTSEDDLQALATALYDLNVRAVDGRYRETNPTPFHRFTLLPAFEDGPARAKALTCLAYQCAEDATINDPLYIALDAFNERIIAKIGKTPEYQNAAWG